MNALPTKVKLVAAFDFGSNATKCSLARIEESKISYLAEYRLLNRLGASLGSDCSLRDEAIERSIAITKELMHLCEKYGAPVYVAVGTEALRKAVNGNEFCSRIKEQCGISVQIISGEEEARLTWLGATQVISELSGNILLFDSGGASTELVYGDGLNVRQVESLPLGAVTLSRDFIVSDPVTVTEYEQLEKYLRQNIVLQPTQQLHLVGCGGGISTLASVSQAHNHILVETLNGYFLSRVELERQLNLYRHNSLAKIKEIAGMEQERADIILPACMLVLRVISAAGAAGLYVATGGIRHGMIICESRR